MSIRTALSRSESAPDERQATRAYVDIGAREIAVLVAIVSGWLLVTWGFTELLSVWIWPISVGMLLLGGAGWKFIAVTMLYGLYTLTAEPDEEERE